MCHRAMDAALHEAIYTCMDSNMFHTFPRVTMQAAIRASHEDMLSPAHRQHGMDLQDIRWCILEQRRPWRRHQPVAVAGMGEHILESTRVSGWK